MPLFDAKLFNGEVFQKYVDRVPNVHLNALINSGAIIQRPDLAASMSDQVGGNFLTTPLKGLISGSTPLNYDGVTDITSQNTKTFSHSRVVLGRAQAWTEKDFSYDITGGVDFMQNVAEQVAGYWDEIDQSTLVSVLTGVFNMSDTEGAKFVESHTYDVTNVTNSEGKVGFMDATTLNTGMQKAMGDHKQKFSLTIMHSAVATNLENLKVLVYLKYNDANGMERDLNIGTLNGRMVLVDDDMPVTEVEPEYDKTSDASVVSGKTYYTRSGNTSSGYTYTAVDNPVDGSIGSYYEVTVGGYKLYTTFVFGQGAIEYTNCGAKVPAEMSRDPFKNGGEDTLISRQRKCFAPYGISFIGINNIATLSPTNAELEDGANWELVNTNDTSGTKQYIAAKAIPIARIISRG